MEDKLDRKIAEDSFLYSEYLKTLSAVLESVDNNYLEQVARQVYNALVPFYLHKDILMQSRHDEYALEGTTTLKKRMRCNVQKTIEFIMARRQRKLNAIHQLHNRL